MDVLNAIAPDYYAWRLQRRSHAHARRLKPQATGCEARLCGLIEPASAGFVDIAEGFSPTPSDFATTVDYCEDTQLSSRLPESFGTC